MSIWDPVVGQDEAVRVLSGAVADPGTLTHAWLLTGPPGSGRSVAARAFAAALQCEAGGCGHCRQCHLATAGTHPDILTVATEHVMLRADDVRPLVATAQQHPAIGRHRVIVIEDADRLNDTSGNVLLKAIEEPPPRTVWVLCAPAVHDVLVTIRSRCRHVGLRTPSVEAVSQVLIQRDRVAPATAVAAARAADCHIGRARRLAVDADARARRLQVLALPRQLNSVGAAVMAAGELVSVAAAESSARTQDRDEQELAELLRSLGAECLTKLPPAVRAQVRQLQENQKRRARRAQLDVLDTALLDLMSLYRDVLLHQLGANQPPMNEEMLDDIAMLAGRHSAQRTVHQLQQIMVARERLAANVAPLIAGEALMVELRG